MKHYHKHESGSDYCRFVLFFPAVLVVARLAVTNQTLTALRVRKVAGRILSMESQPAISRTTLRTGQLVSLLEMLEFYAGFFCSNSMHLQRLMDDVARLIQERGNNSLVTADEFHRAQTTAEMLRPEASQHCFQRTVERLTKIKNLNLDSLTLQILSFQLEELRAAIWRDLYERKFMHLPRAAEDHFNKQELFGELVKQRFPRANVEFTRAGNCFAVEEYTACVFHLMRGLEHGLRALAKAVKVPFPQKYDLQTWGGLLRQIQTPIDDMERQPKTPKRSKDLEFYKGAISQFRFFKNAWRDYVMHTKENAPYDHHEAARVMEHARDFMRQIAPRLKEPSRRKSI